MLLVAVGCNPDTGELIQSADTGDVVDAFGPGESMVAGVHVAPAGEVLEAEVQPGFSQTLIGDVAGRTRAWGLGVADFNEDGLDDIVRGDTLGDIHLLTGNGDGSFTSAGVVTWCGYGETHRRVRYALESSEDGRIRVPA